MRKYTTVIISIINFYTEFKELSLRYSEWGTRYYDNDNLYEDIVLDAINRYFEKIYNTSVINLYHLNKDHEIMSSGIRTYIDHDINIQMCNIKFKGRIDRVQAIVANENVILAIREN